MCCFTTRSGSIRHWTTDHQRRSTMHEGEIRNGLQAKRSHEASSPNLFCPKNGLDNGVHLNPLAYPQMVVYA